MSQKYNTAPLHTAPKGTMDTEMTNNANLGLGPTFINSSLSNYHAQSRDGKKEGRGLCGAEEEFQFSINVPLLTGV